ncbi:MAG: MaoC family dehydratase N-terminal domain-containing protein [Burkholderiaceae bacterium]
MSADFKQWIGKTETQVDTVTAYPVAAMSATLDWPNDKPPAGTPLPLLWHWLYFLPVAPQAQIGPDGHPQRGGFLPPIELPRRMWAGSQIRFNGPLKVGDVLSRTSTIIDVTEKSGRTGSLVFVKARHDVRRQGESDVLLEEFHDIVYRPAPAPGDKAPPPTPAPETRAWERRIVPDDVLLFRYSALTFNGHRIHYDRRYTTTVEGYPGLIVHGPLQATLLLDLLRRQMPQADVAAFEFRAMRPIFDINPFCVCGQPSPDGRTIRLWTQDHEGCLSMDATVTLR